MKNLDEPSVILVQKWGYKSWEVVYNVPRHEDRWKSKTGRSCLRKAHVEMLSQDLLDQGHDIKAFKPGTRCVLDELSATKAFEEGHHTICWKSKQLDAIEPRMERHFTVYYGHAQYSLEDYAYQKGAPAVWPCLLYTSPSPRDGLLSRMPSSA